MTGLSGNEYLADTVIMIRSINDDQNIIDRLAESAFYISAITVGELFFGAYNSGRVEHNLKNVQNMLETVSVLPCTIQTANVFGKIRTSLRVKGRPIPENDIWIAATAMQHGLTLATRDAHFHEVDGLKVDIW